MSTSETLLFRLRLTTGVLAFLMILAFVAEVFSGVTTEVSASAPGDCPPAEAGSPVVAERPQTPGVARGPRATPHDRGRERADPPPNTEDEIATAPSSDHSILDEECREPEVRDTLERLMKECGKEFSNASACTAKDWSEITMVNGEFVLLRQQISGMISVFFKPRSWWPTGRWPADDSDERSFMLEEMGKHVEAYRRAKRLLIVGVKSDLDRRPADGVQERIRAVSGLLGELLQTGEEQPDPRIRTWPIDEVQPVSPNPLGPSGPDTETIRSLLLAEGAPLDKESAELRRYATRAVYLVPIPCIGDERNPEVGQPLALP